MTAPRLVATRIRHERRAPVHHRFDSRSYAWLVDLDDLPDHGPLARFEARDHLGSPDRTIRANVDDFLTSQGIARPERVLMLANARVLGHVFNPLSVFWCYGADGRPGCVVLEVHNTYGDRHAYLVHPDEQGRARVDKEKYVSPFHDTSGWYDVHVPEPGHSVHVAVSLHPEHGTVFSASLRGRSRPATLPAVLRAAATRPCEPLRVALRIRVQGIRLWLRRVPIQPRPVYRVEKERL